MYYLWILRCYDFHPNAMLDIETAIDHFCRMTMGKDANIDGKGYDLLYIDTDNYMDTAGNKIPKKEIEKRINNFLKAYDSFEFIKQEITGIQINDAENDAVAIMDISYKAWVENGKLSENHQGKANFRLHPCPYGGWSIYKIDMPGWQV